jgi:hypothetical protein
VVRADQPEADQSPPTVESLQRELRQVVREKDAAIAQVRRLTAEPGRACTLLDLQARVKKTQRRVKPQGNQLFLHHCEQQHSLGMFRSDPVEPEEEIEAMDVEDVEYVGDEEVVVGEHS